MFAHLSGMLMAALGFVMTASSLGAKFIGMPKQLYKNFQRKTAPHTMKWFAWFGLTSYGSQTAWCALHHDWLVAIAQAPGVITVSLLIWQITRYPDAELASVVLGMRLSFVTASGVADETVVLYPTPVGDRHIGIPVQALHPSSDLKSITCDTGIKDGLPFTQVTVEGPAGCLPFYHLLGPDGQGIRIDDLDYVM